MEERLVELFIRAILLAALVSGPALLTSLVSGLITSVLQTITQIQETTLSFLPKLLSVCLVLYFFGARAVELVLDFSRELYGSELQSLQYYK